MLKMPPQGRKRLSREGLIFMQRQYYFILKVIILLDHLICHRSERCVHACLVEKLVTSRGMNPP
jgi:hypothetical protein